MVLSWGLLTGCYDVSQSCSKDIKNITGSWRLDADNGSWAHISSGRFRGVFDLSIPQAQ